MLIFPFSVCPRRLWGESWGGSCLAFRDFSPLTTRFQPPIVCAFIRIDGACQDKLIFQHTGLLLPVGCEERDVKLPMPKSKKNKNKAKLNLTVRDEQRNKLEQMASIENRFRPGGTPSPLSYQTPTRKN